MKLAIHQLQMLNSTIKYVFFLILTVALSAPKAFCNNDSVTIQKTSTKVMAFDSSAVEVREPDAEKQKALLEDSDYRYDRKGPAPKTAWHLFKEWFSNQLDKLINSKGGEIGLQILMYVLIIAALVFIVILLVKNDIRSLLYGKSASIAIDFKEFSEDIHQINFNELIAIALSQGDFRRAVRLHFLKLLKELTDKNLITWKTDKTNNDYFIELSNTQYSKPFKELAVLYEYIWYGNFEIDEEDFKTTVEKFKSFKTGV